MPISEILANVGGWLANTASRVVGTFLAKKLEEVTSKKKSSPPVIVEQARQDERLVKEQIAHQKRIEILKTEELAILQNRSSIEASRLEMECAIAIDASKDRKRVLELKQEELRLTKLWQEKQEEIVLAERKFRSQESALYRDLLRELQGNEIKSKLQEIQADWDKENFPSILSRQEMQQILLDAQKQYQLLMLFSPPDISDDCPSSFRNNLNIEIPRELKGFMAKHYPPDNSQRSVKFYGKFFKRELFDVEIEQLERILTPVPTVILYSAITDRKVYFDVGCWGLQNNMVSQFSADAWDWKQTNKELETAGNDENDETESLQIIREQLVNIHKLLAAFLADLYYLCIDFNYEPKLFQLESEFPQEWVQHFVEILRDIQQEQRKFYEREVRRRAEEEAQRERERIFLERLRVEAIELSEMGFEVVFEEVDNGYCLVLPLKEDLILIFSISRQYPYQPPIVLKKTPSDLMQIEFEHDAWQTDFSLAQIVSAFQE